MLVNQGDLLTITHARKGTFDAVALRDFDTDTEEWYPVALASQECVEGSTTDWVGGESIPCRASLVGYIAPWTPA